VFVLNSSSNYTLFVISCGSTTNQFMGTYSGTIARVNLVNGNVTTGNPHNQFFNNLVIGGYVDNADNYSGSWNSVDGGDAPMSGATSASYTTPTLSTANNNSQYQVVVYNVYGTFLSSAATLTVNANPTITTTSPLTAGMVGSAYSVTLASSSGTSPYKYAVTGGTLPTGVTLSTGGVLSGTPTANGTYNFAVTVTDSSTTLCTGSETFSVTMTCPTITVSPSTLPKVSIGVAYNQTVTASGGTGPYTFAVASGALPSGLSLSSGGLISGTYSGSAGSATFTIAATDADN
jgi:hypothetical protein